LKGFLKFILPSGIVDIAKNRQKLRPIGRRLSPAELFKSDRLVLDAEQSGLSLFAPGQATITTSSLSSSPATKGMIRRRGSARLRKDGI